MPGVGWSGFIVAAPVLVVPPGQDRVLVTSHSITQALGAAVATAATCPCQTGCSVPGELTSLCRGSGALRAGLRLRWHSNSRTDPVQSGGGTAPLRSTISP